MKPFIENVHPFFHYYLSLVNENDVVDALHGTHAATQKLLAQIDEDKANFKYAEDKWTIKEVITHLLDVERVFAYRALCIARGETASLPSFNQDEYVINSNANKRYLKSMISEFASLRLSTIQLFMSFDADVIQKKGNANNIIVDVNTLGFSIVGHEIHHINILKEKYLVQ